MLFHQKLYKRHWKALLTGTACTLGTYYDKLLAGTMLQAYGCNLTEVLLMSTFRLTRQQVYLRSLEMVFQLFVEFG